MIDYSGIHIEDAIGEEAYSEAYDILKSHGLSNAEYKKEFRMIAGACARAASDPNFAPLKDMMIQMILVILDEEK